MLQLAVLQAEVGACLLLHTLQTSGAITALTHRARRAAPASLAAGLSGKQIISVRTLLHATLCCRLREFVGLFKLHLCSSSHHVLGLPALPLLMPLRQATMQKADMQQAMIGFCNQVPAWWVTMPSRKQNPYWLGWHLPTRPLSTATLAWLPEG